MSDQPPMDHNTMLAFAAGMVAARADCSLLEAIALMQDHADRTSETLDEIATAVIERRVEITRQP